MGLVGFQPAPKGLCLRQSAQPQPVGALGTGSLWVTLGYHGTPQSGLA